jgi:hypothetical protein
MREGDTMKSIRVARKYMGMCVLALCFSLNVFAQNPREIVDKCVAALGGAEAVKKYTSYQARGMMKLAMQGMELSGTLEAIQSGRKTWNRIEIRMGGQTYVVVSSYDGKTAWMDRMGTIVDQPSLNSESDLDHNITLLIEPGSKLTLGKEAEIEGRRAFGIEVEFDGKKTTFCIDQENFTVVEMAYEDLYFGENYTKETLDKRIRYADYKDFAGVLFPTSMTFYQKGQKQMEFQYEDVSFNPQIAQAKFQRPDQKLDLRYSEERIH